ncbi:hypothetical protein [Streptomyces sp. CC224B]|uniref:hypothetical protein n=1 Tax=Streptomyces sp. CC224B TaxID=3044571 RepID=UPI0024A9554D|nr:hypothetical protein [Streptomyces sp. CC224B]
MLPPLRHPAVPALVGALVLATAGTATADTNRSQQGSDISGPVAAVLSPAPAHPDNAQTSRQITDKANTTNWSVIDYLGNRRGAAGGGTAGAASGAKGHKGSKGGAAPAGGATHSATGSGK